MYKKLIIITLIGLLVPTTSISSSCQYGVNPRGQCRTKQKQPCNRCSKGKGRGQEVIQVQNDFIKLQKEVGIYTPDSTIQQSRQRGQGRGRGYRRGKGSSDSQRAQRLQIRKDLNSLLNQQPLNPTAIEAKIQELEKTNPQRWPQPQDYRELLNKKMMSGRYQATEPLT